MRIRRLARWLIVVALWIVSVMGTAVVLTARQVPPVTFQDVKAFCVSPSVFDTARALADDGRGSD